MFISKHGFHFSFNQVIRFDDRTQHLFQIFRVAIKRDEFCLLSLLFFLLLHPADYGRYQSHLLILLLALHIGINLPRYLEHLGLVQLSACFRLLVMNHVGDEGAGQLQVKVGDLFEGGDEVVR